MPWTHIQLELVPEDRLIRPLVGQGGMTWEAARAEVQRVLDAAAAVLPGQMAAVADLWRRGSKDGTVFSTKFTWAVIEYEGDDPMPAARAWIEDYAATIRGSGIDVQVAYPQD